MIGDLPVPGIVVSRCDVASCRLTEFEEDPGRIRVELAYLTSAPSESSNGRGVDAFDGWWVALTFNDGSTFRVGDSTLDNEDDDATADETDDDDLVWEHEGFLRWRESQTSTDGNQVVASRSFDVMGPGRVVSLSSGWERIGLVAGTTDVITAASYREGATTRGARPPGWLTHMAYHPPEDSGDPVDSYTMEWDWPSRLLRWVEVLPDRSMHAHVTSTGGTVAGDRTRLPSPDQIAVAQIPQRLPITGSTFERMWNVARTTGRVPDARHRTT